MSTEITQFGFTMGPATVTRIHDSPIHGAFLDVSSSRQRVEIRVTKGGFLRIGRVVKVERKRKGAA